MPQARRRAAQRRPLEFASGAWTRVDETNPERSADTLRHSVNMMQDGIFGGAWCTRPGFGDPNHILTRTYGRGIRHLSTSSGNEWTAWFFDDKFYLGAFETAPTSLALGGGVVITTTLPSTPAKFLIGSTTFNSKFIVSDSVNKPWTYAPDSTTFTLLSNAPVARAVPTVYYGKVFFIKDASPITIVWSEEGDPTTGYEAGGYTNAWDLTQVSGEPIAAILGTNDALFFWRASAFDMIRGEVSDDFATSGTVSGISSTVGTRSAHAILQIGRYIWFLDQYGRPQRYQIGGELEPIWVPAQYSLSSVNETNLPAASAAHFAEANVVVFCIPTDVTPVGNTNNMLLAFDDTTGAYLGPWTDAGNINNYSLTGFDAFVVGTVKRLKKVRLAHIGGLPATTWVWHLPGDNSDSAALGYYVDHGGLGTPQPIVSHLLPGPLGVSPDHKVFDRIIVSLAGGGTVTNLKVGLTTAEGLIPTAQTVSVSGLSESGGGTLDVPHAEQRVVVGTLRRTRWLQVRLSHATSAEVLAVRRVTVRGVSDSADPFGV